VRRGYRQFQKERLALICAAFNHAAGTRRFQRE
jgi:hypothetical protein